MSVYVVFHSDIEDDKYVRAVCSARDLATDVANSPESCTARNYPGVSCPHCGTLPTDPPNWECRMGRDHFTDRGTTESLCCGVEEWELDSAAVLKVVFA